MKDISPPIIASLQEYQYKLTASMELSVSKETCNALWVGTDSRLNQLGTYSGLWVQR